MIVPHPLAKVPPSVQTDPHFMALRKDLKNSGIAVHPDIVDVREDWALTVANYSQSTSQFGVGLSSGCIVLFVLTFTYQL